MPSLRIQPIRCARTLIPIALLSLLPTTSPSQAPGDTTAVTARTAPTSIASTRMGFGVNALRLRGLTRALEARGYPTFHDAAVATSFGAAFHVRSFELEATSLTLLGAEHATSNWRSTLAGGYTLLSIGRPFSRGSRLTLTPRWGMGYSRITSKVRARGATDFDSVMATPPRGVELTGRSLLFHVGAGLDYRLMRAGRPSRISLGARGGYVCSRGDSDWQANGDDVRGGPAAGVGGAYFELTMRFSLPRRREAILPALAALLPSAR